MKKIYAIGDLHGHWNEINKLIVDENPDIILQCGDFGYWPKFHNTDIVCTNPFDPEPWNMYGIDCKNTTIYFADGNHEDHWSLKKFTKPTAIYDKVNYMPRGSILVLPDGRNVLFIGGAVSTDKARRMIGVDWFPEEAISYKDILFIDDVILNASIDKIDIVISHNCPQEFWDDMEIRGEVALQYNDPSFKALSYVLEKYQPDLWYFGHLHLSCEGTYKNTRWFALNQQGQKGWKRQVL